MTEFDYVVVGAGAAGALIASRLAEDTRATVCLLEAGPKDANPWISVPAGFSRTLFDDRVTWQFETEPGDAIEGRRIPFVQGRTLGGTSSINGMIYSRGQDVDYDQWAQFGNPGWSYSDVLPYFKKTERVIGIEAANERGTEGPMPVTPSDWRHPLCELFLDAAEANGIPRSPDYNLGRMTGSGYFQRTIWNGRRMSTARIFLRSRGYRRNLDIRTGLRVRQILLEGTRAVGVRCASEQTHSDEVVLRARREVIVSAGTANSPKILQLSGIGPGHLLRDHGITVHRDLSGVGENLRDHFSVRMVARMKNIVTMNELARGPRLAMEVCRWMLGKPSILAICPSVLYLFAKSDERLQVSDIQIFMSPASFSGNLIGVLDSYPGMTNGVYQQRPESTGFVRIRDADPFTPPRIQPNYLASAVDQRVLVAGMRLVRAIWRSPVLEPYLEAALKPGDNVADDDLLDYARRNGMSSYHLVGTNRMGPSTVTSSVVDHRLRVHGVDGLRVADASIMPTLPSANTYAPTMMIGEKAATMIREDNL